jgi:hypothetical protein
MLCSNCKKEIAVGETIRRSDSCPQCGADLRICKNCSFYDERVYNECGEHNAERVVDKNKANFCEFFNPNDKKASGTASADTPESRAEALKKAAEALFKK